MIAILKYNAGNISSVENALNRLGYDCLLTNDAKELEAADKVIFPGVGEASSAMAYLRERKLNKIIQNLQQPVLGICLGMQLMCSHSEENDTDGLGIFENKVKKFPPLDLVPHIGWNNLEFNTNKLFDNISAEDDVYFVHSYYATVNNSTIASAEYILPFSAALQKDNFYAVQFHPEKSADIGNQILKNFLNI